MIAKRKIPFLSLASRLKHCTSEYTLSLPRNAGKMNLINEVMNTHFHFKPIFLIVF